MSQISSAGVSVSAIHKPISQAHSTSTVDTQNFVTENSHSLILRNSRKDIAVNLTNQQCPWGRSKRVRIFERAGSIRMLENPDRWRAVVSVNGVFAAERLYVR